MSALPLTEIAQWTPIRTGASITIKGLDPRGEHIKIANVVRMFPHPSDGRLIVAKTRAGVEYGLRCGAV